VKPNAAGAVVVEDEVDEELLVEDCVLVLELVLVLVLLLELEVELVVGDWVDEVVEVRGCVDVLLEVVEVVDVVEVVELVLDEEDGV